MFTFIVNIMLNKKTYILLLLALVVSSASIAQSGLLKLIFPPVDSVITRYDTTKVDPKLDQITLRAFTGYNGNELMLKSNDETKFYSANSKYKLGFGIGYRWLILNAALGSPFSDKYNNHKGETFSFDIQMNIYAPRLQTDLRVQQIDGYYQKTQDEIYTNFGNEGPFIIREDLKLRAIGGGVTYTFNRSYLHKHGFDQTKTMKESGGTLLVGARFGYVKCFSDSMLFKQSNNESIKSIRSFGGGFSLGGAYTFLITKRLFFSIHGVINGAVKNVDSKYLNPASTPKKQQVNFSISPTIRSSFGYNYLNHFIGLYGVFDNSLYNRIDGYQVDYFFTTIKLIYAYRLKVNN
jgi:hypothetical protein